MRNRAIPSKSAVAVKPVMDVLPTKRRSHDGLVNVATGLGTLKSKRTNNFWAYDLINQWQQLDAAYQTSWLARGIVDIPAEDMTREWRRIKSTGAEDIARLEKQLNIPVLVQECLSWAGLFGGSGMMMLTGQDLGKPLRINQIKKGDLKRVIVFDRWELSAQQLNTWDVLAPNYLQPEFYTVQGGHQQIHWSHVVRFMGDKLPRRQLAQTQGWGDSLLRKCIGDVTDMVAAKDGIAELMQEANVDIIKREGLTDELSSDQDEEIIKRYEMFSLMKSNIQMALLDGDETFDRKTLNLSGVAPVIELFMTWISGAAKIPVTKLFGSSAKGLNATGEGDMKNYYDRIRSEQNTRLSTSMTILDEVLVRSALGNFPDDYDYVWNPLAHPNVVETAQSELLNAQKNVIYLEANIIMPSQLMRELQANEEYQFDDDMLDQIEENEDPDLFGDISSTGSIKPDGEKLTKEEWERNEHKTNPDYKPKPDHQTTGSSE